MSEEEDVQITERYLEDLLYRIVQEANKLVGGEGCSIFLKEEGTNRYILRESTALTSYLGADSIEVPEAEIKAKKPGKGVGVTKAVIISGDCRKFDDLKKEEMWTHQGKTDEELRKTSYAHCELPHDRV